MAVDGLDCLLQGWAGGGECGGFLGMFGGWFFCEDVVYEV